MSTTGRKQGPPGIAIADRLVNDQTLASRIAGGDSAAFAEMFRRYHQPLYRFCSAMVGPEEAKDMLQNVMTKAMTSMPEKDDFQMKPWLYRVARNECIDHLRANRGTGPGFDPEDRPDLALRNDPHHSVEEKERLRTLVDDLNDLPEQQRATLVMKELSGLRYAQIAESLGTSESAAKQLVYEARLSLEKAELGRQLDCSEVRLSISSRDGRRLKGRKIRSHMKSCRGCTEFQRSIAAREASFNSVFPVLPAAAAFGILGAVRDGGAAAGALAGGAGAPVAGSLAGGAASGLVAKGLVAAVVVGGLAAGTTEVVRHKDGSGQGGGAAIERTSDSVGVTDGQSQHTDLLSANPEGPGVRAGGRSPDVGNGRRPGNADSESGIRAGNSTDAGNASQSESQTAAGQKDGDSSLPASSASGQARAAEASAAKPGRTGNAPPSKKPAAPPASDNSNGVSASKNVNQGGNSASAPAVGRPESTGKPVSPPGQEKKSQKSVG